MTAEEFAEQVKVLELKPNSVIFVDRNEVNMTDLCLLNFDNPPENVFIVGVDGPPTMELLTRAQLEYSLKLLDGGVW